MIYHNSSVLTDARMMSCLGALHLQRYARFGVVLHNLCASFLFSGMFPFGGERDWPAHGLLLNASCFCSGGRDVPAQEKGHCRNLA